MIGLHALFIEGGVEYRARRDEQHHAFANASRGAIGGEPLRQVQRAREESARDLHNAESPGRRCERRGEGRNFEVHVRFQKGDFRQGKQTLQMLGIRLGQKAEDLIESKPEILLRTAGIRAAL